MKQFGKILAAAVLLSVLMALPAFAAGWGSDQTGYWYLYDNNSYARDQIVTIDGVKYGFNQQAYMAAGWFKYQSNWYYFDPQSGAQQTGWVQADGNWYYLDPSTGIMKTSWVDVGGKRYYLNESGVMQVGNLTINGYRYFANADGSLKRNIVETDKTSGKSIKYDGDGMEWYQNDESRLNEKNGGDKWLPLLEGDALTAQRSDTQESNADYITEVENELYEKFKTSVSESTSSTSRTNRIKSWTTRAKEQLRRLKVSEADITTYVNNVIDANYGEDSGSWTYNGYYYYGSGSYDYDYDLSDGD